MTCNTSAAAAARASASSLSGASGQPSLRGILLGDALV